VELIIGNIEPFLVGLLGGSISAVILLAINGTWKRTKNKSNGSYKRLNKI